MKKLLCILLSLILFFSVSNTNFATSSNDKDVSLYDIKIESNEKTKKIIDEIMVMNYLGMKLEEILSSESTLVLIDTIDKIQRGGLQITKIADSTTRNYCLKLFDKATDWKLNEMDRNHVQFLYNQKTAVAMNEALKPNVMALLTTTIASATTKDPLTAALSIGSLVTDSVSAYYGSIERSENDFFEANFKLDKDKLEIIDGIKSDYFEYFATRVDEYKKSIPNIENIVLYPTPAEGYAKNLLETNVKVRLQYFENNKGVFEGYPAINLELAKCYNELGDYKKCVESIIEYLNNDVDIFNFDDDLIMTYPLIFSAASKYMTNIEYETFANSNLTKIENKRIEFKKGDIKNQLPLFDYKIALVNLDLYKRTNKNSFLDEAFNKCYSSLPELIKKQNDLNKEYVEKPFGEKGDAPINEVLPLNLDIIYGLKDKVSVSEKIKNDIQSLLYGNSSNHLFYDLVMDKKYFIGDYENVYSNYKKFDPYVIGKYNMDDSKNVQPIEWIVLENDKNKGEMLLLSRYSLNVKPYNEKKENTNWQKSSIRKWLNEDFYSNAFNEQEKEKILNISISTEEDSETEDKVFLLNENEIEKYFGEYNISKTEWDITSGQRSYSNKYVATQVDSELYSKKIKDIYEKQFKKIGIHIEDVWYGKNLNFPFYLRNTGNSQKMAVYVDEAGQSVIKGIECNESLGIRPAIWVKYK